jgi:hypothetical protein
MTKIDDGSDATSRPSQSAAPSPDYSNGRGANSAVPMERDRAPWRSVASSVTAPGTLAGIGVLHPMLGQIVAIIELMTVLTITVTALYGTRDLSDRAFRLLRWIGNRPEPPAPAVSGAGEGGRSR